MNLLFVRFKSFGQVSNVLFGALVLVLLGASQSYAQRWQWPDKPENLKVLPKTTSAKELRGTMVGFVTALGVRCNFCHVGEDGKPLSTFDFKSDEKEEKQTARIMMKMAHAINSQFLAQITGDDDDDEHGEGEHGEEDHDHLAVSCVTCHQGQSRPTTLEHILSEAIEKGGVDAAISKYHALRDRFYGGFTYDFREGPLNTVGYQQLAKNDLDGATKLFKLNVEMNPQSANAHDSLGEAYMKAGNKALAIEHYQKSLELNPRNRNAKQMLEKLKE